MLVNCILNSIGPRALIAIRRLRYLRPSKNLHQRRMSMRGALVREFGGPEVIGVVDDLPKPAIKTGKQVLIRVAACGVNPVDTYIRNGHYAALPELPYIPGRDGAGVVEEVGAEVSHVKPGDRVFFLIDDSGSAAEYCVTERVFPLPSGLRVTVRFSDIVHWRHLRNCRLPEADQYQQNGTQYVKRIEINKNTHENRLGKQCWRRKQEPCQVVVYSVDELSIDGI
ncbi:GroES-like protein [Oesophagostomum dentatum]|uniref:GroES-like protein n=1 Tax=Oesophagostomum dentatum TaxID=61180 RepID=A0A0B1TMX1_OESDE|nr:GroES-like protein [Oesophagostomum dentatum]